MFDPVVTYKNVLLTNKPQNRFDLRVYHFLEKKLGSLNLFTVRVQEVKSLELSWGYDTLLVAAVGFSFQKPTLR